MEITEVVNGRTVRFGREPRPAGKCALPLRLYMDFAKLPAPQPSDWTGKIRDWPTMLNDRYGDCVVAAKGHAIQIFTAYGLGAEVITPDSVIKSDYFTETGGADNGLNIPESLDYWVRNGLGGKKILAWADVNFDTPAEVMLAGQLFGGVYLGVSLPSNCFDAINAGRPWTDTSQSPNPRMGHCIHLAKIDADGPTCVTWGQLQKMTWDWFKKYTEEASVLISADWEGPLMPAGINNAALMADYQEMTGKTPPPSPPDVVFSWD